MTRNWGHAPVLIAAASIAVLGTALASQYIGGLAPCELCIYQRWPYVFTIAAGLSGWAMPRASAPRRWLVASCAVAFAIGAAIAVYHAGVEYGWLAGPGACSGAATAAATVEELRAQFLAQPVTRCDEPAWALFGVSMAGYNAVVSAVLAGASALAVSRMKRRRRA